MLRPLAHQPLETRQDLIHSLRFMLDNLYKQHISGNSGIELDVTCAHYGAEIAKMEALSRSFWGLFPLVAHSDKPEYWPDVIQAIKNGVDPQHPQYWGETEDYDQRLVEMASFGLGFGLLGQKLVDEFSAQEIKNLHKWLSQITGSVMPDSNWNFFSVMVHAGFKNAGLDWDKKEVASRLEKMDAYYLGDGWYSDGVGRPKDYYISMAFHYYGLVYSKLMMDVDPVRCKELQQRAALFAQDFIYFSSKDGSSLPFGRSLVYRFSQVAFWSAIVFAELDVLPLGQIKGIIFRHLKWWFNQDIFTRDGILNIGYAYPNLIMAEDYNSPGSPYWSLKTYLLLALPEEHPFWHVEQEELPTLNSCAIPHAQQLIVHNQHDDNVYMLTAGQVELNNYVNTTAKYGKFAYSTKFGFTLERGRVGKMHASPDSTLLLSECDGHYRTRRECDLVSVHENYIYSKWLPWHDVEIETWLIACEAWHVRVHRINNQRVVDYVEGGFALPYQKHSAQIHDQWIQSADLVSEIISFTQETDYQYEHIVTPPNNNILFPEVNIIPTIQGKLDIGTHILSCAVRGGTEQIDKKHQPSVVVNSDGIKVEFNNELIKIEW
ncbi:MAG: DUF2264 domain-containing protein [Vibrio sp.]